jgi:hypothetical protein
VNATATDRSPDRADVVLLSADRLIRAPLRAQLIEDGFEVIGTDTWPAMRRHLRPGDKPRLAIVDLHGLDDPDDVIHGLRVLMPRDRVLILSAAATVDPDALVRDGFRVIRRPAAVADVARAVADALRGTPE